MSVWWRKRRRGAIIVITFTLDEKEVAMKEGFWLMVAIKEADRVGRVASTSGLARGEKMSYKRCRRILQEMHELGLVYSHVEQYRKTASRRSWHLTDVGLNVASLMQEHKWLWSPSINVGA